MLTNSLLTLNPAVVSAWAKSFCWNGTNAVLSDAVAEHTAIGWEDYRGMAQEHFDYLKAGLDRSDPSYRD